MGGTGSSSGWHRKRLKNRGRGRWLPFVARKKKTGGRAASLLAFRRFNVCEQNEFCLAGSQAAFLSRHQQQVTAAASSLRHSLLATSHCLPNRRTIVTLRTEQLRITRATSRICAIVTIGPNRISRNTILPNELSQTTSKLWSKSQAAAPRNRDKLLIHFDKCN